MTSLTNLPDLLLIEVYEKAISNDLEVQFIELLYIEMKKRGMTNQEEKNLLMRNGNFSTKN